MSFPNPGMLPLSEAGGALSGANFGVFYTVLMQVGYKHFAPRVLKQLNEGMSLVDALMQVQEELRPFNNRIIVDAIDRLPTMLDLTAKMLEKFIQDSGQQFKENIGLGGDKGGNVGATQAQMLAFAKIQLQQYIDLQDLEAAGSAQNIQTKGEFMEKEIARDKRLRELEQFKRKKAMQVSAKKSVAGEFGHLKPQIRLGGRRLRPAGQSQKLERIKLIKEISIAGKWLKKSGHISPNSRTTLRFKKLLKRNQQQLINLLSRYSF